jgi:hypothetical protein
MQMFVRHRRRLSVIALAVAASACGSDSPTAPVIGKPASLGQALTAINTPALAASVGAVVSGSAGTVAPAIVPSQCAYAATSQSFVCAPLKSGGLTFNQSFSLLSATGAKQNAFDQNTTAAVRTNSSVAGTLTTGGSTFNVDGVQEFTLSGLLNGKHLLDGTSTTHAGGTLVEGETRIPFVTTIATTLTALAVPVTAAGSQLWPTSGVMVVDASTAIGGVSQGSTKLTITFTGSGTATVSIVGPSLSQTCKVTLTSSAPMCG